MRPQIAWSSLPMECGGTRGREWLDENQNNTKASSQGEGVIQPFESGRVFWYIWIWSRTWKTRMRHSEIEVPAKLLPNDHPHIVKTHTTAWLEGEPKFAAGSLSYERKYGSRTLVNMVELFLCRFGTEWDVNFGHFVTRHVQAQKYETENVTETKQK